MQIKAFFFFCRYTFWAIIARCRRPGIMGKRRVIPDSPFPLAVHAVDSVPLGVQLCQGIRYLCHFLSGSFQNHIRLALVNHFNLLTQPLQTLLYTLKTDTQRSQYKTNWITENTHCSGQFCLYIRLQHSKEYICQNISFMSFNCMASIWMTWF